MNGKGNRPIIGYNNSKFRDNYDSIFRKHEDISCNDAAVRKRVHPMDLSTEEVSDSVLRLRARPRHAVSGSLRKGF